MRYGYALPLIVLVVVGFVSGYIIGGASQRVVTTTVTLPVTKLRTVTSVATYTLRGYVTRITTLVSTRTLTRTVTATLISTSLRTLAKTVTTTAVFTRVTTERVVVVPRGEQVVIAWMLNTCNRSDWEIIERYARVIDVVSPDWYYLTEELGVGRYDRRCAEDKEFIEFLKGLGIKLMPMLVTANSEWVRRLVTDPSAIDALAAELVTLAKRYGYYGYNIDFEVSIPENAADFASFIDRLAKRLHRYGLVLTVDVPAKRMEWPSRYTATYDYALLGKTEADAIIIMAYDFYEWSGRPKPVAPIWWVEDCVKYALRYIPREKLILGIPNYGKVWFSDGSFKGWLLYPDWLDLLRSSGRNYTVDREIMEKVLELDNEVAYFVDGEMGYYRALIAVKYGLKGIAVWRLDKGDPEAWGHYARALGKQLPCVTGPG